MASAVKINILTLTKGKMQGEEEDDRGKCLPKIVGICRDSV